MKDNWISVEDRLPKTTQKVLVYSAARLTDFGMYYICPEYGNGLFVDIDDEDYPVKVTHWQPLPEAPK